jgi:hypothetical protein
MAHNSDKPNDDQWVDDRLKVLGDHGSLPVDATRARARLRARVEHGRVLPRPVWAAAAAAASIVVLLALPWPRAAAQQLWDRLTLGRIEIVRVTDRELPEDITAAFTFEDRSPWKEEPVQNLAEAARIAGFQPSLPPPGVLRGAPRFAVVRAMTSTTLPVRVKEVERALAAAGITDVVVPPAWEGVTLAAEGGPIVLAQYPEAMIEVAQLRPIRMTTPAGVHFDEFMEVGFRVFGRSARDAHTLAKEMLANPAILMHFPKTAPVQDVRLHSGRGILVGGACFFFNTNDRLYLVSGANLNVSVAATLANSIQ